MCIYGPFLYWIYPFWFRIIFLALFRNLYKVICFRRTWFFLFYFEKSSLNITFEERCKLIWVISVIFHLDNNRINWRYWYWTSFVNDYKKSQQETYLMVHYWNDCIQVNENIVFFFKYCGVSYYTCLRFNVITLFITI